jgi:predicted metal-dependent hydrolase
MTPGRPAYYAGSGNPIGKSNHTVSGRGLIEIAKIIRSKRRSIALIVERDGSLVVRAPLQANDGTIRRLVESKADWIRLTQEKARKLGPAPVHKKFVEGEEFWFLGQPYRLEIVKGRQTPLYLDGSFRMSPATRPKARLAFENWYKKQAKAHIPQRVSQLAAQHGFEYQRIRITSARTRWGSCSTRGTLSFTWRLVMAPENMIDYVIVHELVHLHIHNHSKEFWEQVGLLMPDYKAKRLWLKKNAPLLTLD